MENRTLKIIITEIFTHRAHFQATNYTAQADQGKQTVLTSGSQTFFDARHLKKLASLAMHQTVSHKILVRLSSRQMLPKI